MKCLLRSRNTGVITIIDAIKTHPDLSQRQKDELIEKYQKMTDTIVKDVLIRNLKVVDKELSAMTLMTLHNYCGFGKKRLMRFAKQFGDTMDELIKMLEGTDISAGAGCYSDLKSLYPDCDEWIGESDDESICGC